MTPVEKIKSVLFRIRAVRPELELELELDPSRFRALTDEVAELAEIPVTIAAVVLRDLLSLHRSTADSPKAHRGTVREIPLAELAAARGRDDSANGGDRSAS